MAGCLTGASKIFTFEAAQGAGLTGREGSNRGPGIFHGWPTG